MSFPEITDYLSRMLVTRAIEIHTLCSFTVKYYKSFIEILKGKSRQLSQITLKLIHSLFYLTLQIILNHYFANYLHLTFKLS